MTRKSHVIVGISVSAAAGLPWWPAAIAAIVPDVDYTLQKWTRKRRSMLLSHRGILHHALWIPVMLTFAVALGHVKQVDGSALLWLFKGLTRAGVKRLVPAYITGKCTASPAACRYALRCIAAFCVGYASHLLTDALTYSGIPIGWRYSRRFSFKMFATGSPAEYIVVTVIALAALIVAFRRHFP